MDEAHPSKAAVTNEELALARVAQLNHNHGTFTYATCAYAIVFMWYWSIRNGDRIAF